MRHVDQMVYIQKYDWLSPQFITNTPVILQWYEYTQVYANGRRKQNYHWVLFWMGGDREQRDTVFEYLCSHPFDHGISYVYFMGGFFHTPFGHFPFHLEAPNPIMNVQIMWNWSLLS